MRNRLLSVFLGAMALTTPALASAEVRITEFMYQGVESGKREFFELTNIGGSAVDVSGWSYNDDNTNDPVSFGSTFGSLAANESVILTELTAAAFRSYWGLSDGVRVFSIGTSSNLGGSDTINIYNSATQSAATLVDSVTYSGTTAGISRNRPVGAQGTVSGALFVNSAAGDVYGSGFAPSTPADFANPGRFPTAVAAVPEPTVWAMLIVGFGVIGGNVRRRGAMARRTARA